MLLLYILKRTKYRILKCIERVGVGCPIFAYNFFSLQSEVKQKPFRFLFASFRETKKLICGFFRFNFVASYSIKFFASFRFLSLQFLSLMLIYKKGFRIKFLVSYNLILTKLGKIALSGQYLKRGGVVQYVHYRHRLNYNYNMYRVVHIL